PDFGQAVFDHPLTDELRAREEKPNELALAPAGFMTADTPLFLWIVPQFDEFVNLISGLTVIRTALDQYWQQTYGVGKSPPDPKTSPLDWLNALGELSTAYTASKDEDKKKLLASIASAIEGAAEGKFETAKKDAQ